MRITASAARKRWASPILCCKGSEPLRSENTEARGVVPFACEVHLLVAGFRNP